MFMKKHKSAIKYSDFINQVVLWICDFIDSGCGYEVPFKPFIVNPLTVTTNKLGKMRLIWSWAH